MSSVPLRLSRIPYESWMLLTVLVSSRGQGFLWSKWRYWPRAVCGAAGWPVCPERAGSFPVGAGHAVLRAIADGSGSSY